MLNFLNNLSKTKNPLRKASKPPLKGGETPSYNSDAGNLDWGFGAWPVSPIGGPYPYNMALSHINKKKFGFIIVGTLFLAAQMAVE